MGFVSFAEEGMGFPSAAPLSVTIPHTHPLHSETVEANPLPATSHHCCPPFSSMEPRPQESCQLPPRPSSSLQPAVPNPPSQTHKIFGQQRPHSPSLMEETCRPGSVPAKTLRLGSSEVSGGGEALASSQGRCPTVPDTGTFQSFWARDSGQVMSSTC